MELLERIDKSIADIQKLREMFKAKYGEECIVDKDTYETLLLVKEHMTSRKNKDTPLNVVDNTPTEDLEEMWYQCPICNGDLTKLRSFYCPYCGQRLDWSEDNE